MLLRKNEVLGADHKNCLGKIWGTNRVKHSARCNEFKRILNQESRKVHVIFAIAGGGGGTVIYGLYRYVPL